MEGETRTRSSMGRGLGAGAGLRCRNRKWLCARRSRSLGANLPCGRTTCWDSGNGRAPRWCLEGRRMDFGGDRKSLAVMVRHRLTAWRPSSASAPQPRVLPFRWGPCGRTDGRTDAAPGGRGSRRRRDWGKPQSCSLVCEMG